MAKAKAMACLTGTAAGQTPKGTGTTEVAVVITDEKKRSAARILIHIVEILTEHGGVCHRGPRGDLRNHPADAATTAMRVEGNRNHVINKITISSRINSRIP